ncbi:bifunctional metallophosphatase/5'-nucleotidase [Bradymonas sediminis]|uniref:Bifunctional metallophosphatase/5'-nucleotidase n=1 Tax=Bradymonas sediminis TaxID=1548548 RepID=A0A2Z4FNA3_9DELT|nr:bifunctional metallophosphatase/5'-nucleotidase [Bradymonas sediminis]AWV90196.1 bifunctional metallophosphatase/5'-nucleotidase [Bradymonas sediminis]TDP75836.1 5'-nucleotidase [Bradymonas sediminis]
MTKSRLYLVTLLVLAGFGVGVSTGCAGKQPVPDSAERDGPGVSAEGRDADGLVPLRIVAINDLHGNLEAPAGTVVVDGEKVDAGGVAYIKSYVEKARAGHPNSIVVAAGDLVGATPLVSAVQHDEPTIESLNKIGLELSAVGNHEFDAGWQELLRKQNGGCFEGDDCTDKEVFGGADFDYLAANVVGEDGETILPGYRVKEFGGIPVGFIGLVLEGTPKIVAPNSIRGLTFRNEAEVINEVAAKLQAEGVEAIVVLIHEGGQPETAQASLSDCGDMRGPIVDIVKNSSKAVDLFITGHTHRNYICTVDERLVTSAYSYGRILTEVDVKLDPKTGDIVHKAGVNEVVRNDDLPADVELAAMVKGYVDSAAVVANQPVGRITAPITREQNEAGESALGDLIADSQLVATQAPDAGGAQIAFMNAGGIRESVPGTVEEGSDTLSVTYADMHRALPFGNTVVTLTLTGAQIHRLLEQQWAGDFPKILQVSKGFTYEFDPNGEIGSLVDPASIKLNGLTLDPSGEYRVTVNGFLASGGDGFTVLGEGTNKQVGPTALDVAIDYFKKNTPVAPGPQDRIKVKK